MNSLQNAKEYIQWVSNSIKLDSAAVKSQKRMVYRGQVYWCWFGINIGAEMNKKRPCVIVQNRLGNLHSPNVIVAPITHSSADLDVVAPLENKYDANNNLILDGYVNLGNIVTVSKARLDTLITTLSRAEMELIDIASAKSMI